MNKNTNRSKTVFGLIGVGCLLLGYFILEYMRGPLALIGCLLLFFGAAAKLMQYVLKTGQESTKQEIPWAERVRAGLEKLELAEDPSPVESHDHIPSTAPEKDEKLEQLKVLLGAGLIDREEYEKKRREIRKDA